MLTDGSSAFATTHWSVVLSARGGSSPAVGEALETLCRIYWLPLYAYIRRRGHAPHDAQDLTQEFFYRLLDRHYLSQVDPSKGKFRSFLLVAVNHFLANEWDRNRALKRGGAVKFIPLDASTYEESEPLDLATGESPEKTFERRWALALLAHALGRLKYEAGEAGRAPLFERLKGCLTGEGPSAPYAVLAAEFSSTEAALKMTAQRWRHRFAELVREEIARTVNGPAEVEVEIRSLFTALSD
jgi:RNA polymerase sigma-70 factor (ECF subfamily)